MSIDIANCWLITCVTNMKVDKWRWANFTGNCLRRDIFKVPKCLDEVVISLSPYESHATDIRKGTTDKSVKWCFWNVASKKWYPYINNNNKKWYRRYSDPEYPTASLLLFFSPTYYTCEPCQRDGRRPTQLLRFLVTYNYNRICKGILHISHPRPLAKSADKASLKSNLGLSEHSSSEKKDDELGGHVMTTNLDLNDGTPVTTVTKSTLPRRAPSTPRAASCALRRTSFAPSWQKWSGLRSRSQNWAWKIHTTHKRCVLEISPLGSIACHVGWIVREDIKCSKGKNFAVVCLLRLQGHW